MRYSMRTLIAAGLGLVLGVAACNDEQLAPPPGQVLADPMFARYVSMGNSITAGFQSAGILDSTQKQSYAYLIAHAAGTEYYYQSLRYRGCAPPFTNNVTQTRYTLPGFPASTSTTCDLATAAEHPWLSNTAVPGARMIEATNNFDSTGGVPTS